jgi:hypothetical protein
MKPRFWATRARLKELAALKSVNEAVRFLLTMMEQQGDVIRARLRKKKKLKIPARRRIGKAFEADETHRMRQLSKKSRLPIIYLALGDAGSPLLLHFQGTRTKDLACCLSKPDMEQIAMLDLTQIFRSL